MPHKDLSIREAYLKHWRLKNATKILEKSKEYYEKNRESGARFRSSPSGKLKIMNWRLKGRYGITLEEYAFLLDGQGGVCAICKNLPPEGKRLYVDHCHNTSTVRGLLCQLCNTGLGTFKDSEVIMAEAIEYLTRGKIGQPLI